MSASSRAISRNASPTACVPAEQAVVMAPTVPTWFKYRQGKAEPAGENSLKVTAPNVPVAYLNIRQAENANWWGILRLAADGPDTAVTEPEFTTPGEAWGAAFELYRNHVVIGPPGG